jgi:hypothetical protein
MESGLNTKYGSKVNVVKDTTSTTAVTFDQSFLLPKKTSVKFLMGGIFFNGQTTLSGDTIYEFTTVANTKIPTSYFYLQTLAA